MQYYNDYAYDAYQHGAYQQALEGFEQALAHVQQGYDEGIIRQNIAKTKLKLAQQQQPSPSPLPTPTSTPAAATRIGAAANVRDAYVVGPGGKLLPIASGGALTLNAHVKTGPRGHLQVLLLDETVFTLGPNSDMVLDQFVFDPSTSTEKVVASFIKGTFRWVTGKVQPLKFQDRRLKLSVGVIGIRGTDFQATVVPGGSGSISLYKGSLLISPGKGLDFNMAAPEQTTFTSSGIFTKPSHIASAR